MEELSRIKSLFRPIQPAVKADDRVVIYLEVEPEPASEDFVHCFWQLKTNAPLEAPFIYRVVSDGCIDIFFNHRQPAENFVMGFCRKYTEFPIGHEFDYIGIRFLPAAFPLLFDVNAKSISNVSHPLAEVLPDFSAWITSEIRPEQKFEAIVKKLSGKLGEVRGNGKGKLDERFFNSLQLILEKKGHLDLEKDLQTGLSPRQLRRIFNHYIGTTPKAFCDVVRFQHILNAKPSRQSLKDDKLYFDAGFFDQAHFIKHFKKFYGVTPTEAFR